MGSREDGIKMLVNAWQIYQSAIWEPELTPLRLLIELDCRKHLH